MVSKAVFEPGDAVYACPLEENECSGLWYPGTVTKAVFVNRGPEKGNHEYDVVFDDNPGSARRLQDQCVMTRSHILAKGQKNDQFPRYLPGSRVIACWRKVWGGCSGTWFPGTVEGSRVVNHGPRKGARLYHIKYDDGRVDKGVEEIFIMTLINSHNNPDLNQPCKIQIGSKVLACWHTEEGSCTGRWYPCTITDGFTTEYVRHGRGSRSRRVCSVVYEDGSINEGLEDKYILMLPQKVSRREQDAIQLKLPCTKSLPKVTEDDREGPAPKREALTGEGKIDKTLCPKGNKKARISFTSNDDKGKKHACTSTSTKDSPREEGKPVSKKVKFVAFEDTVECTDWVCTRCNRKNPMEKLRCDWPCFARKGPELTTKRIKVKAPAVAPETVLPPPSKKGKTSTNTPISFEHGLQETRDEVERNNKWAPPSIYLKLKAKKDDENNVTYAWL